MHEHGHINMWLLDSISRDAYNKALEDVKGYLDLAPEQLDIINCLKKGDDEYV